MPFRAVFTPLLTLWASIAAGVFVVVTGLLLYALARNRARRREHLPFAAESKPVLEIAYAVVLGGVAAALVTGSFIALSRVGSGVGLTAEQSAAPPAAQIEVTAFRWCWDFAYRDAPVHVTGDCVAGTYPTVVVPVGQTVEFDVTSRDVLHAFWLPDFDAKIDAFPDHTNTLRMIFPEQGRWRGRCSEYCGPHHATMDFYVRVVSAQQYRQFLAGSPVSA